MVSNKDLRLLKKLLPKRTSISNKIDGGKVLIIGGGKGLYGAGILSALSATKTGAGYTHLMTDLSKFSFLKFPDFIVHPIKLSEIKKKEEFTIGIGPGLGITLKNLKFLKYLIKNNSSVVADADALTLIAKNNLAPLPKSWILTPHEGELARLLNISSKLIKNDREKYLKIAVKKFHCTILLKGHETLIFSPEMKKTLKICFGSPALAKAGTGDVLLGIITALIAQKLSPKDACLLGSFLQGESAKAWEKKGNDQLSLRPLDIIDQLPKTIFKLRK